jgi:cyclic beta-1,2-glucan synthetase
VIEPAQSLAAPGARRSGGPGTAWARRLGAVRRQGGAPLPGGRLDRLRISLAGTIRRFDEGPASGAAARAAEWLLDNAWLVQRSIDLVEESLPGGFCRRLPAGRGGVSRVESLAREIVLREGPRIEPADLEVWVEGAQRVDPLTIGELWALPAMVRWALVEELAASAASAAGLPPLAAPRALPLGPVPPAAAPADPGRVAACIQSLRALDRHDWKRFVEAASAADAVLRRDPCGAYAGMTFATKDRYRKAVEELARHSSAAETEVAAAAVGLADEAHADGEEHRRHVGFWLVDDGRRALESLVGFRPPTRLRLRRRLRRWKVAAYLAGIALSTLAAAAGLAAPALAAGGWTAAAALLLCLLPGSAVAVAAVHWAATRLTEPRVLPKLEIEGTPPAAAATLIVVPAMLTDAEEVAAVLLRAEANWLANADAVLGLALLFDFPDAQQERAAGDEIELQHAVRGVRALNRRHGRRGRQPFLLLLREREWSVGEGRWIGWERKRGKLHDFNRLALGEPSRLRVEVGDATAVTSARFAITLDADTILPPGAAHRLIGTLAHPLNRAVFDGAGRVVAGYTVLQPRIDIAPWSVAATAFARISSGERGLDLYSRAVSDVYQDLFGEGIYVGKGIYDIAAFHRSLEGRVPEARLLSHDLFEGLHGRAALVSDVALLEEFPGHPLAWIRRQHRWIRGDWQIAPWLLPRVPVAGGGRAANRLSLLDRWKIADNLRRSLVAPALLALLAAGWLLLPGPAWWWTAAGALVPGAAFALGTLAAARSRLRRRSIGTPREWVVARVELARWLFALALIPAQAVADLDAVVRALARMLVSHRHLLEWTPAYRDERAARAGFRTWRDMAAGPLAGAGAAALLAVLDPARLVGAAPLLAGWVASPALVAWMARPSGERATPLAAADRRRLRRLARRTWSFFEATLGPDDHWLPPDHVQEAPRAAVARRTSPTNIGLTALATLAAWDLGYLPASRLAATLENLFDSLDRLERFRGHFFNWYDTHRLLPLAPRYVSTVDSGNLACSLVALARGLEGVPDEPLPRLGSEPEGLVDAIEAVRQAVERRGWEDVDVEELVRAVEAAAGDVLGSADTGRAWRAALDRMVDRHLPALEGAAAEIAETAIGRVDPRDIADLRHRLHSLRHQARTLRDDTATLLPWLELPPGALTAATEEPVPLTGIPAACAALRRALASAPATGAEEAESAEALRGRLDAAEARAAQLAAALAAIAGRADRLTAAMRFRFLYDANRRLFRIGYDVDAGRYDPSWYDLLASEARSASYFAIATGAVPPVHWVHLGRPFAQTGGRAVLLSWAGTLFEYLMPGLFLGTPRGSLLDFAVRGSIAAHIDFARRHHVPWGVSESGYHDLDPQGGYRYRAFGVPDLAMRREVEGRVVVAPYACCLAASLAPAAVARNLERLEALGADGPHGLYEAIDFGRPGRRRAGHGRVVRASMAHHQAMILLALDNALLGETMVDRFLADRRMGSFAFLLYENTPERVPARTPIADTAPRRPPRPDRPSDPGSWGWTALAERPRVQILSNGRWSTLISDRGSGGVRWQGYALTRWRADPTVDRWGTWIYLQDLDSGALWSATARPTRPLPRRYEVLVAPHAVEFHREELEIFSRLLVCVAGHADVELRRVHLRNDSARPRRLGLTSFGEVALARQADDRRHPAFSKLFVESRYDAADRVLYFRRRGAAGPSGARLAHAVSLPSSARLAGWETDRGRFLGRGGRLDDPEGLRAGPAGLSRSAGATLDPAFALGCEVDLGPGAEAVVTFLTAIGGSEAEALAAMDTLRSEERVAWAIGESREGTAAELAAAGISGEDVRHAQALLCGLVYPCRHLRREVPDEPRRPRQGELWALGVSGDNPLMLLRVARSEDTAETLEVLRAHAWLRSRRVRADLIVLEEESGGYADLLHGRLQQAVARTHGAGALGRDGGVHYVPAGRLDRDGALAIEAAAAVNLATAAGGLAAQLGGEEPADRLPPFLPLLAARPAEEPTPPLPATEALDFAHRRGGLSSDGREYVVRLEPGRPTPAPWCNVIANPDFGFLVSERGGGFTWSESSGERRLTPWSNDPVLDPAGEVLYLRDEETGAVWSATPAPAGDGAAFEVRHGAGVSQLAHHRHGLEQRLRLSVAPDAPVKLVRLELVNRWQRTRSLTATFYAEWTLGGHRDLTASHVVTELAPEAGALLARECFSQDFPGRVAFLAASEPVHGFTADRRELLGEGGLERPAGLERIGLGGAVGAGYDPCGALQVHVELAPGERRSLHFLLGEAVGREAALALVDRFRSPETAAAAEAAAVAGWEDRLGRLVVRTPEPAMDAMLNRWLPYQALACRLWARSAFYQSSGAFGFRDQLQDSLAFLTTDPGIARAQILACAARQFVAGDVLHWWHPPAAAGARTRCSDDLVWLPFAIAAYVEATGDRSFPDARAPYLEGAPLVPGEAQRYDHWPEGPEGTLYEHGSRALERAWTRGPHGLPLIGGGDWNDGMDRVGDGGHGESVWLGWFLLASARSWAPLCEAREGPAAAARLAERAEALRRAIEDSAWDGAWYRRAYYDDGTPLGTAGADEAQIDSIAQSWAVLSGAADPERARQAIESAVARLVREDDGLALLLDPPFDRSEQDPGYIKGYPPGVRENGGQYTHAATWLAWAFAELGDGDRAERLFRLLDPLHRATTDEEIDRYRVEPFVVAADVASAPPHVGRGGWTWYTGSAAWLWRLGAEAILGIRRRGGELLVDPCIPRAWPGFEAVVRLDGVEATIRVENPDGVCGGVAAATLDGRPASRAAIPLDVPGKRELTVRLGTPVS